MQFDVPLSCVEFIAIMHVKRNVAYLLVAPAWQPDQTDKNTPFCRHACFERATELLSEVPQMV
jgi:hypothetical protein